MNPIFKQRQMNQQGSLQQFLNNVKDPRQQVMSMIQNMSPDKRHMIADMLPKARAMASRFGINDFDSVATEINKIL